MTSFASARSVPDLLLQRIAKTPDREAFLFPSPEGGWKQAPSSELRSARWRTDYESKTAICGSARR